MFQLLSKTSKGRSRMRGVFFPIAALLFIPLMLIFFGLGIDTFRVKQADLALRAATDRICQSASKYLPFQNRVASKFIEELTAARSGDLPELRDFKNIQAKLLLSAHVNQEWPLPSPPSPLHRDSAGELSLADLSDPDVGCGDDCDIEVVFDYDFDLPHPDPLPSDPKPILPDEISDRWSSQGTLIGCEITGKVRSLLPAGLLPLIGREPDAPYAEAKARFAFGHRIFDAQRRPDPDYSSWDGPESGPAFVLAIAPQLITGGAAVDPLMTFKGVRDNIYPGAEAVYNAFSSLMPRYDVGEDASAVADLFGNPNLQFNERFYTFPSAAWSFQDDTSAQFPAPYNRASLTLDEDATLLRLAQNCMNPVTLLRNVLASTLVELAARSGHFRHRTEILLVNSEPVPVPAPSGHDNPSRVPPTVMVRFGNDLLRGAASAFDIESRFDGLYQTPYLPGYFGGDISGEPNRSIPRSNIGGLQTSWINPLTTLAAHTGSSDEQERRALSHRILAAQLRICNVLYYGGSEDIPTVNRPLSPDPNPPPTAFDEEFIERERSGPTIAVDYMDGMPEFGITFNRPKSIRKPENYTTPDVSTGDIEAWEQQCPWSELSIAGAFEAESSNRCFGESAIPASGPQLRTRGLSASELVATLGTAQTCPIPLTFDDSEDCDPSDSGLPLANPDLVGIGDYLHKPAGRALLSPGLFPFTKQAGIFGKPQMTTPKDLQNYYPQSAFTTTSFTGPPRNLVVILHRPPATTGTVSDPKCLPDNFDEVEDPPYRAITIVYIPAPSPAEGPDLDPISEPAIDKVRECYGIDPGEAEAFDGRVRIIVLSPREARYQVNGPNGEFAELPKFTAGTGEQQFATYWAYLLTGAPLSVPSGGTAQESIIDIAISIFNERLVEQTPIL